MFQGIAERSSAIQKKSLKRQKSWLLYFLSILCPIRLVDILYSQTAVEGWETLRLIWRKMNSRNKLSGQEFVWRAAVAPELLLWWSFLWICWDFPVCPGPAGESRAARQPITSNGQAQGPLLTVLITPSHRFSSGVNIDCWLEFCVWSQWCCRICLHCAAPSSSNQTRQQLGLRKLIFWSSKQKSFHPTERKDIKCRKTIWNSASYLILHVTCKNLPVWNYSRRQKMMGSKIIIDDFFSSSWLLLLVRLGLLSSPLCESVCVGAAPALLSLHLIGSNLWRSPIGWETPGRRPVGGAADCVQQCLARPTPHYTLLSSCWPLTRYKTGKQSIVNCVLWAEACSRSSKWGDGDRRSGVETGEQWTGGRRWNAGEIMRSHWLYICSYYVGDD